MRALKWFQDIKLTASVRRALLVSWLISFSTILGLLAVYFVLQPEVPLFYSAGQPEAYLARKEWLFVFPSLSFGINIIHVGWLQYLRQYKKVLADIFAWTTVSLQLLISIGLIRIIWIIW